MPTEIKTTLFIENNLKKETTNQYKHTAMVSHMGKPVSFAMAEDGRIYYSVLDLSNTQEKSGNSATNTDRENDKNFWSKINFDANNALTSLLYFPQEISQVGYEIVPNKFVGNYDKDKKTLSLEEAAKDKSKVDLFYSSTARLGAVAPFQALSDGKYIYLFRQSIDKNHTNNIQGFAGNADSAIVNNTLLVDRFILSGSFLKPSREIRYQRSRHKTEPESKKDTLAAADVEGNPFYEPTRELAFANNLTQGNFSVLLLPGADAEEQRWQIFTYDSVTNKVNNFNIRFDYSIVFDTTESQTFIDETIEQYELDKSLITDVQAEIRNGKNDDEIANILLSRSPYNGKNIPQDALAEVIYTIRTGVTKDDFILASTSDWPLIEYENNAIKSEYLLNGKVKNEYAFSGDPAALKPRSVSYTLRNGISSCYYYQQEMGPDNKPIKNKACVMLAVGIEDKNATKYIGIINFAVAASGQLSRLTTDVVNLPDINVQALDENPYKTLEEILANKTNGIAWQQPQKMSLIDIDPNGLSTSGGVLKFAYTSADIASSAGYSDAAEATFPYLFDDSLGRVNLYFKGKNNNFFVLYFNPTGNKGITITDQYSKAATPLLSFKPRLDRDMTIGVTANVSSTDNSCTLTMKSGNQVVETWQKLPKRYIQIAAILSGAGELSLGTLDPLGLTDDLQAAYKKPASGNTGTIKIRTTLDNNLMFQNGNTYANELSDGKTYSVSSLNNLSAYLSSNTELNIAKKKFTLLTASAITVKADVIYQSYLSGMVDDAADITKLWNYLKQKALIQETSSTQANLKSAVMTATQLSLSSAITDTELDALSLELLQEGSDPDKKARRSGLKESLIALLLDIAKIRIVTFTVQDANSQSVDRLEAGLATNVVYNLQQFTCTPTNLGGTSAAEWEHPRSYLFNPEYDSAIDPSTEIDNNFNYTYAINNTIGQWEDWEASLALEFNPASATNQALLSTTDSEKLKLLQPTEKGLSVEAWIKPSATMPTNAGSVVYYKNSNQHYALGIEKDSANPGKYKCIATLGDKKYITKDSFDFTNGTKEIWKHLAFTHKKYWGYKLNSGQTISCGKDDSLYLDDEFSLEALVKIDAQGTILQKNGEYTLNISNNKIQFVMAGIDRIATNNISVNLNTFYKITLIRSRNKPETAPSQIEYPLTGSDQNTGNSSSKKWYQDQSSDTIIKGMAEKQDQMESKMNFSAFNMLGNSSDQQVVSRPKYWHTLIITDNNGNTKQWQTSQQVEVQMTPAYQAFIVGGNNFAGTFASIRIWNRALSIGDAKKLDMPENKTGLISHWRIAEGKGNYLYDNTSENHGIANGGSWTDSPQTNQPGQFQFYIDGTPVLHDSSTNTIDSAAINQLSLGGYQQNSSSTNHFKGILEEIRIWNLPRTNEQITDNAFGRLQGEWEQLIANYTFDSRIEANIVKDASSTTANLTVLNKNNTNIKEVLSTAPVATEIPQIRSAITGVITDYHDTISSRPIAVEYGDVQKNDDGTLSGILKRCYSFIDASGAWYRMTGYKVGDLISQWYGQAQFAPQVVGYMEGAAPVPGENFPITKDSDMDNYPYALVNTVTFNQSEEISYNYSTSKESGWNIGVESEAKVGGKVDALLAPFGFGISVECNAGLASSSNWQTSGTRSQSYERGVSVNTNRGFKTSLAGYDNQNSGDDHFYTLGNTGHALVKSKTADIYLLRLAHNNALVSISWQPNPDIPEDVNIISFPINPLYTKQGTLDGKFGDKTDHHYPQAQSAYGEYSYYKPREAYKLKKQIEREKAELENYFQESFDVAKTNAHFQAAAATTGIVQALSFMPAFGSSITSAFNQIFGQIATQVGYNNTELKDDLAKMGSQRNLANTYVWTIEGGFYAESTEVAETQQETYSNQTSLSLGGGLGVAYEASAGLFFEQQSLLTSGSSFTLTKSKTKASNTSFGLEVNLGIPLSPRYKYAGVDKRTLAKGLIKPGTVDAYRFMSFYLEPKAKNFTDLFTEVIDPIWLEESADPSAQALRQARGNIDKAKPCWRIMHRVTYVSRVLPQFTPEAPPSLEKAMRIAGIESNHMLIKKFEPHVANISKSTDFFNKIDNLIDTQLPEFINYKKQVKNYLALYFNMNTK